jgi:hypothetical protein
MDTMRGGCHCGNIVLELTLTRSSHSYQPRACDCSFCRKHGAAYVSDPQGALRIGVREAGETRRYRQGSGQAELLLCRSCGVLVGALLNHAGRLYAAVNARVLDAAEGFGAEQSVSPRLLSGDEKVKRWQAIWFSNVSIDAPRV